jgi:hypothetical protein
MLLPGSRVVRPFLAAAVTTATFALAGCTSAQTPQAQVPSLPASGAASAPSAATPTDADVGRPRERIDMTNADIQAMWQPYNQCLIANGYDKGRHASDTAAMAKAQTACVSKDPLPPWELDASNPHGADFVHAVVLCLRARGIRYVSEEPPAGGRYEFSFGGPQNDQDSITKGLEYTPDCEKQVAAQGIGH